MVTLTPQERLIVAADFKPEGPNGRERVREQVLNLAADLYNLGVCLKVNSVLRACGYELIEEIRSEYGLRVFADLKLCDIPNTLETDGKFLRAAEPDLVTVVCATGTEAIRALKAELPDTEVLGVTVLTSLTEDECQVLFSCSVEEAVVRFSALTCNSGLQGLVCSAAEATMLRSKYLETLSLNTPAIRPEWAIISGDDQNTNRVMTPAAAIKAGADRIVVGRPIVNSDDRRAAAIRTIEEIATASP